MWNAWTSLLDLGGSLAGRGRTSPNLTSAERVHGRLRVVSLPVEPVVVEHVELRQAFARQRTGYRPPGEVPFAPGLRVDHQFGSGTREELQCTALDATHEGAHGSAIRTEDDHDRRRPDRVDDRTL